MTRSSAEARAAVSGSVRAIRERPSAYLPTGSYAEVAAFVCGLNSRLEPPLVEGFREWFGQRGPRRPELAFWQAVMYDAVPGVKRIQDLTPEQDAVATRALLDYVLEYLSTPVL